MKYSQRQIEVWQAREKLDRALEGMAPEEMTAYAKDMLPQIEKEMGRKLKLRVADLPVAEPLQVVPNTAR